MNQTSRLQVPGSKLSPGWQRGVSSRTESDPSVVTAWDSVSAGF